MKLLTIISLFNHKKNLTATELPDEGIALGGKEFSIAGPSSVEEMSNDSFFTGDATMLSGPARCMEEHSYCIYGNYASEVVSAAAEVVNYRYQQ